MSPLSWNERPLATLIGLAWPIAISTVSYSVMTLVDTLLVGHVGRAELAGVGLAGTITFTLLCFSIGLLQGAKVLVSQAMGARRPSEARAFGAIAWASALVLGVVTVGVGQLVASRIGTFTSSPDAARAAETYLSIRVVSAPMALLYVALREVRYARGDSRSPMRATVVANLVNIALAVLFIFVLGWGVRGAAWATVIAQSVEAGLLMIVQREVGGWSLAGVRASHARALLRIGVPTGFQLTLEVGAFALLSLLVSRFSEIDMAAHQIALQGIHFSFLPAMAVAEAASVLAGQAVGAGRDDLIRKVARKALALTAAYTGACALLLALGRGLLVRAFTSDTEVLSKAAMLLLIGAAFQVADGANVVARGVLRGAGDVRFAAIAGVLTAWMATPPLTWLLGYRAGLGAVGGWLGLCVEIVSGATLLWWRVERGGYRAAAERARVDLKRAGARAPALAGAGPLEQPLGSIASSG